MKRLSVIFVFLLVGIFLFSFGFVSALNGGGYCPASTDYQWLVCDCGSAAVVYDLIHISSVPGLPQNDGVGSCAGLGLACGSTYQCYRGNTVICTDPSWGYSYTVVPSNPLGCCSDCGNPGNCYSSTTYYRDLDGDGYGSSTSISGCTQPAGYVSNNLDCNDSDSMVYPGATEICDGKDNNCDGQIDVVNGNNVCSCVVGANYDTITSAGGYWATGCCNPPSSYWGCPPSLGGSNTNPGAGLGTCVSSGWVDTGSITNYFCSGTSCNTLCSPNSAVGCTSSCSSINSSYWTSLNGLKINNSNLGDTVLLVYGGKGLTGKTINYSINVYNASGAVWWNPFSYFSKAWDSSQKILGDAYEPFTLTQTNLHRFNASIVGTNQWNMSNNLTVLPANSTSNSLPIAIINSPANDSKVQSGSLVWFNQSSTDEDDLLNITWDFGDGSVPVVCDNYSTGINSTQCNIQHLYSSKGVYLVKLTATEMVRAQSSQQMMLVYVFSSGINVVPVINTPRFGVSYGNFVDFDASGSYVANCSTTSLTRDFPQVGNLNCTYLHAPNTPSSNVLNGYNLIYSWNMGGSSLVGNWSSYNSAVVFKYYFASSGVHNSKLNLTYTY